MRNDILKQLCVPLGNGDYIYFMDITKVGEKDGRSDEYAAYRTEVLVKLGLTLSGAKVGPMEIVGTSVEYPSKEETRKIP